MKQTTAHGVERAADRSTSALLHPLASLKPPFHDADGDEQEENERRPVEDDANSDRIVAANVLLLAAAAAASNERSRLHLQQQQQQQACQQSMDDDTDSHEANNTTSSAGSGPLKKRKSVIDILRQKPEVHHRHHQDPYHVSPMSHGSKTLANETPASTPDSASRVLSYESRDESSRNKAHSPNGNVLQNSHNRKSSPTAIGNNTHTSSGISSSSSNHSTNNGSPKSATQFPPGNNSSSNINNSVHSYHHPSRVVPYFASALHWLLTESSSQTASPEYAAARPVLQWVPHGQAWRVVRWDSLRKQVLPQFFPQLTGSIDAFLWHLAVWGFEEIQDGPDVGAFGHTVRVLLGGRLFYACGLRRLRFLVSHSEST